MLARAASGSALAGALVGTLEAAVALGVEMHLKRLYLGEGRGLLEVLAHLVDRSVLWSAPLAYGAVGALGGLTVAAATRAWRSSPEERWPAVIGLASGLGLWALLEVALVRRGAPGGLWPPAAVGPGDLVLAAAALALLVRLARRAAVRLVPWIALWRRPLARACAVLVVLPWSVATAVALLAPGRAPAPLAAAPANGPPGLAGRPDVLLVVLDTARADRFSTFGAARETSPALSALARRGATFVDASSPAPWTLPAHGSLFTGELPHAHGASWGGGLALGADQVTLAERFREAGYETLAFTNNPWIGPLTGLSRGFAHLDERWRDHGGAWDHLTGVRLARRVLAAAGSVPDEGARATIAALARRLEPVPHAPRFVFVNLMELHDPNWPAPGAGRFLPAGVGRERLRAIDQNPYHWFAGVSRLTADDLALLVDLYDAQVAYLDRRLGELVAVFEAAAARRAGAPPPVVAVVGDHGENLGDHGALSHVFSLHQTLLHVPLVLVAPGRVTPGARIDVPVSTVDLAPTLEELAGLAASGSGEREGRSWLSRPPASRAGEPIIAECHHPTPVLAILESLAPGLDPVPFDVARVAVRVGPWKLILASDGRRELFDLARDPGERIDRSSAEPARVAELAAAAGGARVVLERTSPPPAADALDPEREAALQALGYLPERAGGTRQGPPVPRDDRLAEPGGAP